MERPRTKEQGDKGKWEAGAQRNERKKKRAHGYFYNSRA